MFRSTAAVRLASALSGLVVSQAAGQVISDSETVVVPGPQYQAGGFHRFFLGDTYRSLWATPIRAPVLDLGRHGGGLVATERGGSKQSRSLRFRAQDGRVLVFRALDKDPTQTWPPALRASGARKFAEDQISAILPAGAVAVAILEQAAGLVNPGVSIVVLPDDPRLGEWREEFAGNLGILEHRLRGTGAAIQDLPGADRVVDSEALFERLRSDGRALVDQRAYLAARLLDLVVGDWDRHSGQWAWARFDESGVRRWIPIPRDRDWALSRLDGPLYGLLRLYLPKYQSFGKSYGSIYGLTVSAEPLDRRLLGGLEQAEWNTVAAALVDRLTDSVIDQAVSALPPEYPRSVVNDIAVALRTRRDQLPEAARRFYRQLAGVVELRGSDESDMVDLLADPDGGLRVALSARDSSAVRIDRRFVARETKEIRLYLLGGADTVRWHGGASPIKVRVIDSVGIAFDGPPDRITVTDSTSPFKPPVDPGSPLEIHRDWGALYGVAPWVEVRPEIGFLVGGGPVFYRYGFERAPYRSRVAVRAAYASEEPGLTADVQADFRFRRPGRLLVRGGLLRLAVVRYFGEGNETERSGIDDFNDVRQRLYFFESTLQLPLGKSATVSVGGFARASRTDLDRPTQLALDRPYGSGDFALAGVSADLGVDTRDHPTYPTRGVDLSAGIRLVPGVLDVARSFAVARLHASSFVTAKALPATPTLALRSGVSHAFGSSPFFETPTVGGRSSVRALNSRRFMGETAIFGSAEVRLDFGGYTMVVPGEWGVYGLVDAGRVFLEGERSNEWHPSTGAGLWFAFLDRRSTMTVTYARSEERAKVYIQAGFHF